MKKAKIEIDYNEYGFPILERLGNPNISFRLEDSNELIIEGNKDGLRLLAKALLGMAEYENCDDGFHIHLDDLYEINNADKTFIISKNK